MAIEYRKFLTGAGTKEIVRRIEIVRRAVRVLDLELLCRLWKLEKHVDDIEEAGLGGHLDDYETKAEAEAAHEALQTAVDGAKETAAAALQAAAGKQDALTEGTHISLAGDVVSCTLENVSELANDAGYLTEVEAISVEEVDALF